MSGDDNYSWSTSSAVARAAFECETDEDQCNCDPSKTPIEAVDRDEFPGRRFQCCRDWIEVTSFTH